MHTPLVKLFVTLVALALMEGCSQHTPGAQTSASTRAAQEERVSSAPDARRPRVMSQPSKERSRQQKIILKVPVISQKPELLNGCEVTSVAMLLRYAGLNVGKMELSNQITKDSDALRETRTGVITHWGNPNHGFVGDMTGKTKGYAVYHSPTEQMMKRYLGRRTLNLTGSPFEVVLDQVTNHKPVVVWTTSHFSKPAKWEIWNHGNEKIRGTLEEHAVLLVGYDPNYVYVNDPLTGKQAQRVARTPFIESWVALGRQALSYR